MARSSRMVWLLGLIAATMTSSTFATETCEGEADILFVVDSSGSITQANYQTSLNFLSTITSYFKVGPSKVLFAALVFSTDYSNEFGFMDHTSNSQVEQAIEVLPYFGRLTYTGTALKSAREFAFTSANGARNNVAKIAIVITDGKSTDAHHTRSEAYLLKQSGVTVIVIGVGSGVDQSELEDIASRPDLVINCGDFDSLVNIRALVEQKVCDEQNNQPTGSCLYFDTSCIGKNDGDYAACDPECKDGYYYSCVAEFRYLRPCGLATYIDDYNNPYQARMVYDPSTGSCEREYDQCPRDPQDHEVIVDPWNPPSGTGYSRPCLSSSSSCLGRPNGNYPMCYPDCQSGFYYACSNNETIIMPCPLGNYLDGNNNYYQAMMVYNNETDSCELQVDDCPRNDIDHAVTTNPGSPSGGGADDLPPYCTAEADILLVVDSSGSIGTLNYAVQKFFLSDVTSFFDLGPDAVQFSAIVFSTSYSDVFSFTTYYDNQALSDAILAIPYLGSLTYTNLALSRARVHAFTPANGARDNVGKVVVVITDGKSTNPSATFNEADSLKASGVTVIAIGVGAYVQQSELEAIASSSAHIFNVQDFSVLGALRNELVQKTCESGEIFSTCVTNTCVGRADGDYPACDPDCRDGFYYSCSNGFLTQRECPLDNYMDENDNAFFARTVYNHATGSCERSVASCPRDPADHEFIPTPYVPPAGSTNTNAPCVDIQQSCAELADGDYPMCYPECQNGYFVSCVAGEAIPRTCPYGTYQDENGVSFQAMMVYNSEVGYCTLTASSCPRNVVNPNPTSPPTSPPAPPTCQSKGDVLLIVDASGSIGQSNYDALTSFVANMITYLEIGPNDFQIAALVFSTDATLEFEFGQYTTEAAIFQAILDLPYKNGLTNTHLALEKARLAAFDPNCGAREDVSKVAIIFTDGVSRRPVDTELEADRLKRAGVTVIVVGIGGYLRQSELEALASSPNFIFRVDRFSVLDAIKNDVITTSCESTQMGCLVDETKCSDAADGLYPFCGDECKAGYYIQCSNNMGYKQTCSLGLYTDGTGQFFYARLVFDPSSDPQGCQQTSSSCPRNPQNYQMMAGGD